MQNGTEIKVNSNNEAGVCESIENRKDSLWEVLIRSNLRKQDKNLADFIPTNAYGLAEALTPYD